MEADLVQLTERLLGLVRAFSRNHNLSSEQTLQILAMTEGVMVETYPGTAGDARLALFEGHAILSALQKPPRADRALN